MIEVIYRITGTKLAAEQCAEALAVEQSVEMPVVGIRNPYVLNHIVGQVLALHTLSENDHLAHIALDESTCYNHDGAPDFGQLMNMLFGNASWHSTVQLHDFILPEQYTQQISGPRFGIEGWRQLTKNQDNALSCSALKPQGSSVAELADICQAFASGGVDLIKDDHGLCDQPFSPFAERVAACQRRVVDSNARTGNATCYIPHLGGNARELSARLDLIKQLGINAIMVAPMLLGFSHSQALIEQAELCVLAHPAYAGGGRVNPVCVLGKLFRLLGCDAVIYPNHGGRFNYSVATCTGIAEQLRAPWQHVNPALPVPAGGMTLNDVHPLIRLYGADTMLLIGGDILREPQNITARTRSFVDQIQTYTA